MEGGHIAWNRKHQVYSHFRPLDLTFLRPLDALVSFSKVPGFSSTTNPVRYAVRQVLDQEYRKESIRKNSENLSSTGSKKSTTKSDNISTPANPADAAKLKYDTTVKRDFFGRIIQDQMPSPQEDMEQALSRKAKSVQQELSSAGRKVWVTYHDGFSNAVRKPISMAELLSGL
jgi:chromosome transmission fidelity protein 18